MLIRVTSPANGTGLRVFKIRIAYYFFAKNGILVPETAESEGKREEKDD